jgi:copper chaperone NosL
MRILALASIALAAVSCAASSLGPAEIRLGEDACAHCRMTLLSSRTAAQIVAPAEEPIMFDELGCLRDYLSQHSMADGARVFVADHRTGAWVDAATAIFTKTPLSTPMSSGLIAHADQASRDADEDARDGVLVPAASVLQPPKVNP